MGTGRKQRLAFMRHLCSFFLVLATGIGFILFPSRLPTRLADFLGFGLSMGILYGLILIGRGKRTHRKFLISFVVIELFLKQHHHLIQTWVFHEFEFTAYQIVISKLVYCITPCRNEFFIAVRKRCFVRK